MSKYVYKLEPKPLYENTKEMIPLYYNTEQEAYEARAALWANGEISPWSEITRIDLESPTPKYYGVILKAELIPPKCTLDGWRIDERHIMPIPYKEFADLIYKYFDKDKYDSYVLKNAKSVLDLRQYLPYISPKDNRGRRFFYDYFYDNTLRDHKRILNFLVKEAYEEYIKNNDQELEPNTENFVVPKETFDNTSTDFYQLIPINAKESTHTNMTPLYYRTFDEASEARSVLWAEGKISTKSVIAKIELEKESPKYQGVILKTKLIAPKNILDGYKITDLSDIEPISFKDFIQLYYNTDNKEMIEENAKITEIKKILPCVKKENGEVFFYIYFSDNLFRFACYSRGNLICMIRDEFDKYKKGLVNIF